MENINIDKITESIISYLEFVKKFKNDKSDDFIINGSDKNTSNSKFSYIFRDFNNEGYIIDKKYFDIFRSSINFNELYSLLDPLNEENKKKFKEELKKYLEKNPLNINEKEIHFYSKEEEMKEIVKNFKNYSFINEELLVNGMGIDASKLKGNLIKVSKNEKNTILMPVSNNFILFINKEKKDLVEEEERNKEKINKEYKNLYYVEEITKKIFILLYFHKKKFQEKLKSKIKDIYNFKKYYLINSEWLEEYKQFFLYDLIEKKLDEKFQNYSYKQIKNDLDNISKNGIGQIRLFNETKVTNKLRNELNIQSKTKIITIKKNNNKNVNNEYQQETIEPDEEDIKLVEVPANFDLVNEDIFELLIKEEFFFNKLEKNKDKLFFEILYGNNQILIKNKINEKNIDVDQFVNNYLIYVANKDFQNENNKENENNDKYTIKYILYFDKNSMSFNNLDNLINKYLNSCISNGTIDLNKKNCEQNICDKKKNILGKFINIGIIDEKELTNYFNIKNINDNKHKYDEKINDAKNKENKNEFINKTNLNNEKSKINKISINNENKDNKDTGPDQANRGHFQGSAFHRQDHLRPRL